MLQSGYLEWCNENAGRSYPLAESATCVDREGKRLPPTLLVDAGLIVPSEYAAVFCTAVRMTPTLVSLAFGCESGGLLTGVYVLDDYQPYTAVPLTPLVADVSGWVVFGSLQPQAPVTYLFDSVQQSALETRAVRIVDRVPVRRFLVDGTGLEAWVDGMTRIAGGLWVRTYREGSDTLVIELNQEQAARFLGPCEQYADAGHCGFPPVTRLAGVPADENGVLTFRFVPRSWSG